MFRLSKYLHSKREKERGERESEAEEEKNKKEGATLTAA